MRSARRLAPALLVLVLAAVSACSTGGLSSTTVTATRTAGDSSASADPSGSSGSGSSSSSRTAPSTTVTQPPVAAVSATPAFGSTDLAPIDPITVSVAQGTIDSLVMTNPEGREVSGTVSADRASWTVGEELGFGKTYTVTGTATGTDRKQVPISGTFTTVKPEDEVRTTVNPGDGEIVGVAAPVTVSFGVEPEDRALIEKNVTITTDPAVEGAWAWIKHDDGRWALDWRPREYWPANTKVHVDAKVYGLKFGEGAYGAQDLTSDFSIGRNQVVKADVNSFEMVVQQDGVTVASYPASYGKGEAGGDPNLITRSGVHVVNEFNEVKLMNNPRYGYTNSPQKWAVRISNNGEFIHANPNSVGSQGSSNVTHGCINLSTEHAEQYFKGALWGDPVEITGTSVELSAEDGDIYDWAIPWDEWLTLSAL
jgi:lipoprotein-anchoring transpeptidase ErfK/SrfK